MANKKISTILDMIDDKHLFVPAFQREYVWKKDDAKQLIDSLIKEYPTGTMLIWETTNPPEIKGPHKYNEMQGAVRILLDGQQRLTTLYMLIRGEIPPYYTVQDIKDDTRGLHVNLETLELSYYLKSKMENNPYWQNITDIFQGKVSAFDLEKKFKEVGKTTETSELKKINDNINSITLIKEREFPEQNIPVKASIRKAIDIFYKVNASGVSLTEAELALAQISGYWPRARDTFKAKLRKLEDVGFVFKLDFIIYVLLGCLYHMGSDLRKLHGEENKENIRSVWDRLENHVLDYVVTIMRDNAFVDHTHEINSPYALVPIIVYCYDKNEELLTDAQIRKMVKWFYYSQIRSRYVSQLPQKLDSDLRIIAQSDQPFDDLIGGIAKESRLEVLPSDFEGCATQHPLFSMLRWYLKSRGAVCLTTGLSLRNNKGKKYQLKFEHIFPYSKLKEVGYGRENRFKYALAQEFTNRVILTHEANRPKSVSNAADYLTLVMDKFPKALELQCIPLNKNLWNIENYEQFLDERRKMLAKNLNEYLNSITEIKESTAPVTLEDMIAEGESDELEFKSTLRWDLKESVLNRKLEDIIMKSVAAFANAHGGTILIGVGDDGTVIGLEYDYTSLGGVDRDKFELHLRNLLNQQFGVVFVANKIQIKFHQIDEKEVCEIEISQANEPMVVKLKDKNNQTIEKFYVRSGNSSQELSLSEINTYFKERFL
jgi:uncharacterized protein with ParB-like and HNH nuclease domain